MGNHLKNRTAFTAKKAKKAKEGQTELQGEGKER